jgi:hypothetical protein
MPPFDRRRIVTRGFHWPSRRVLALWLSQMSFAKLYLLCFGAGLLTYWLAVRSGYFDEIFIGVVGVFYLLSAALYCLQDFTKQVRKRK